MQLTENLKLKKPDLTDYVNVSDLNDNMDALDREVGELKQGSTTIEDLQTENKTLAGAINELERDKADKTYVDGQIENIKVPVTSVNEKTGAVTLTANDVGAVPTARKVNNKALSADIALTASDVGASPTNHGHAYSEISGKPSTFPPSTHTQDWGTISGKPTTFPPSAHTHASSQVGLGSVQNYGIATTAEAQAGAVNNKYMTPALTKAAIKHIATTGGISMVKSVQRGFYSKSLSSSSDPTASDNTVNISNINPNKSEITINCRLGGSYEDRAEQTVVKTLNNNSFVVEYGWRGGGDSSYPKVRIFSWQIIEYY